MIILKDIYKTFRTGGVETAALQGVDLHIRQGEFVAVMGPSGCGKSTLLNLIGLLDIPTAGQYLFEGTDVSRMSEERLTRLRKGVVGFIFQNFNLIDDLTVAENVELPLVYAGVSASRRRRLVEELLERMKLDHRAGFRPQELSGGQQQQVAVARAVIISPHLILADEPTGNLDSNSGRAVMMLLDELNRQGTTVIMATHNEHDASFAGRIVRLLDGRVVAEY